MEQDNQDLNDLVELEASFLPEEQTAAKEIAKILRDKNFSYKQKVKYFILWMKHFTKC